jgi:hypothetical protein
MARIGPVEACGIPAVIGVTFTALGSLKLHGLQRGIVGDAGKSLPVRLCGT